MILRVSGRHAVIPRVSDGLFGAEGWAYKAWQRVAPLFLVCYSPLAGLILQVERGAVSRCVAKLLHVAVLSSELRCRTKRCKPKLARGGQHH